MAGFTLFPAIDLRGGRCVRLQQGDAALETGYSEDPVSVALGFCEAGADWIHVVDLDAAFGEGSNRRLVADLARRVPARVQTGGGVRTEDDVAELLHAGVARVVIGTAAVERPALVGAALARWGSGRVAVGLDARGSDIALRGWRQNSGADLFDLAGSLAAAGLRTVIYTDIARDGMLAGTNTAASLELARRSGLEVVVSGGVRSLDDVLELSRVEGGIAGAIVGKALYEGHLDLREALIRLQPSATS